MGALTEPLFGVPAPPDSPANVPDAPAERPGPSEPLEPGLPDVPDRTREDEDAEE